jgi:predicted nicotinamide N-methyase
VPSIVAALRGARVLATDWSPAAVELAARNARRNGVALETAVVAWADPGPAIARAPWDLVLASDVLYERRNVDLLLELLPALVAPGGEVLLADPRRPPAAAFLAAAGASWRITTLPLREGRLALHRLVRG